MKNTKYRWEGVPSEARPNPVDGCVGHVAATGDHGGEKENTRDLCSERSHVPCEPIAGAEREARVLAECLPDCSFKDCIVRADFFSMFEFFIVRTELHLPMPHSSRRIAPQSNLQMNLGDRRFL